MALPKNVSFHSGASSGGSLRDRQSSARRLAIERERAGQIDQDELAARSYLALREIDVVGPGGPGPVGPDDPFPPPWPDETSDALSRAYNAVVEDGRYVPLFKKYPKEAARLVGIDLPQDAADAVVKYGNLVAASDFAPADPNVQSPVYVVAVAVVVVAAQAGHAPERDFVVDSSGLMKL